MSNPVQGVSNPWQTDASSTTPNLRAFANLNLTEDQRSQLRQIFQNAQSQGLSESQVQNQVNAVLTPAQQQQLQTDVQNARSAHSGRHHHRGGGESGSPATTASSSSTTTPSSLTPDASA